MSWAAIALEIFKGVLAAIGAEIFNTILHTYDRGLGAELDHKTEELKNAYITALSQFYDPIKLSITKDAVDELTWSYRLYQNQPSEEFLTRIFEDRWVTAFVASKNLSAAIGLPFFLSVTSIGLALMQEVGKTNPRMYLNIIETYLDARPHIIRALEITQQAFLSRVGEIESMEVSGLALDIDHNNALNHDDGPPPSPGTHPSPTPRHRVYFFRVNGWASEDHYNEDRALVEGMRQYELNAAQNDFENSVNIPTKKALAQLDQYIHKLDIVEQSSRFRAVQSYAEKYGFVGAFPDFNQADAHDGRGLLYALIVVKTNFAERRVVPASELGNPQTFEERFRAVQNYASQHGFVGGFPDFNQADDHDGRGLLYGLTLVKADIAERRVVPASELGNPQTSEDRFRAVQDYASQHGFVGGFPDFNQADDHDGRGLLYGLTVLRANGAERRVISVCELQQIIDTGPAPVINTIANNTLRLRAENVSAHGSSVHILMPPPSKEDARSPTNLELSMSKL